MELLKNRKRPRSAKSEDLPNILRTKDRHEGLVDRIHWKKVIVAGIIGYLLIGFLYGCFSILDLKDQENSIIDAKQQALAEQQALRDQVAYLQTDEAMEMIAREQLGMVKPGEVLITQQTARAEEVIGTTS